MREYVIELAIYEGRDEFWESIKNTGCDEVVDLVSDLMESQGFQKDIDFIVKLKEYKDDGEYL